MNLGAPELLIVVIILIGFVPWIIGIVRAAQNGDTGWLIGIIFFGWIAAIIYLATHPRLDRVTTSTYGSPPPPLIPSRPQPAGWFPDPRGRFDLRYWDGREWTDDVSRSGITSKDPV